jgi:hypothetical protein
MTIDTQTLETASAAGQLLIRAAATLGTLTPEQQVQLAQASSLPALLAASLSSAQSLCPEVQRSMSAHPPRGFLHLA